MIMEYRASILRTSYDMKTDNIFCTLNNDLFNDGCLSHTLYTLEIHSYQKYTQFQFIKTKHLLQGNMKEKKQ